MLRGRGGNSINVTISLGGAEYLNEVGQSKKSENYVKFDVPCSFSCPRHPYTVTAASAAESLPPTGTRLHMGVLG